jgi:hypothetical protein
MVGDVPPGLARQKGAMVRRHNGEEAVELDQAAARMRITSIE